MKARRFGIICVLFPLVSFTSARADAPKSKVSAPDLEKAYQALDQSVRAMDRQRFDSRAVLERTGRNPQKQLEWVRDNTTLVPYRGALRGPTGVLLDRVGNSLDRSLLLAQMIDASGFEVRLANATLGNDTAQKLLEQLSTSALPPPVAAKSPQVSQARDRVARQSELLLKVIGATRDEAQVRSQQVAALSDHWWVQWKQDGKWVDADLTGASPARAVRTVPYSTKSDRLSLEARDCQEVELRVVIESFKGGKLQSDIVLRQMLRPAELFGRSINFSNSLGVALKPDDLKPDVESRKRLKSALIAAESFIPAVRIDSRPIHDASFTTAGEVNHSPQIDPAGKLAGATGKAMGGMFGGLSGQDASKPNGVLTAQWLEFEIRVPGQPTRKVRHDVFDLLGPAARAAGVTAAPKPTDEAVFNRALHLLGQTQILLQACELTGDYLMYEDAVGELALKPTLMSLARGDLQTPERVEQALDKASDDYSIPPMFALIRDSVNPGASRTFIDQPNVVLYTIHADEKSPGELVNRMVMDLASTSTAATGADGFKTRLARGVADTLAEQLVLGSNAIAKENTVGVFEAGGKPIVVRPGDVASLAKLQLPADAQERAKADLAAGNVLVLASADAGRWGWWRVDPTTGQCVGVMDSGYHQTLAEREATMDEELAAYSDRQGIRFTRNSLRKASPEDIANWSKGHAGVQENLEGLQEECKVLWECRKALIGAM